MGVKEWLNRYQDICTEIDVDVERSEMLRQRLETAHRANLDGMPHTPGYTGDRIGATLARIEEIEQRTRKMIDKAKQIRDEIEGAVSEIHGGDRARKMSVIRMRYIDFFSWKEVNAALFGQERDFELREDSFLRRTTKIHAKALDEMQIILDTMEAKKGELQAKGNCEHYAVCNNAVQAAQRAATKLERWQDNTHHKAAFPPFWGLQ